MWWAARGIPTIAVHGVVDGQCTCWRANCPSPGKHPIVADWPSSATTDAELIAAECERWPNANVGAYLDVAELFAIDVDGEDGWKALAAWEAKNGTLPRTMLLRSGRGHGGHLIFKRPAMRGIKNRVGVLKHVDVRGKRGQIVVWPSVHISGGKYEVDDDCDPAPAPGALLDLIDPPRVAPAPYEPTAAPSGDNARRRVLGMIRAACARITALLDGRRAALVRESFTIGGYLQVGGVSMDEAAAELCAAGRASGTQHNVEAAVMYGLKTGAEQPRSLPMDSVGWEDPAGLVEAAREAARLMPRIVPRSDLHAESAPKDTPQPPIVKFPGSTIYVRGAHGYFATDEKMLQAELEAHHPNINLWVQVSETQQRPKRLAELFHEYGRRGDALVYSMVDARCRFVPGVDRGGTLIMPCARPDGRIEAAWDDDVHEWLTVLLGDRLKKGLDWLATAYDLTQPTSALYLQGPPSCGKGMIAAALAGHYGVACTDYADVVGSAFNSALRGCPIVHLDERAPKLPNGSAGFRSLISESQRALTEKYRPAGTLVGCPRLVITANNGDALRLSEEDLTREDEDAIARRVLHIMVNESAAKFLASRGGRAYTADWVTSPDGGPGRLVNHIAALAASRRVQPGGRFLVEGEDGGWWRNLAERGGMVTSVLLVLAEYLSGADAKLRRITDVKTPIWAGNGELLVNVGRLHEAWIYLSRDQRPPMLRTLANSLKLLSNGRNGRPDLGDFERPRVYYVPGQLVIDASSAHGVGDEDAIARSLKMSTSTGMSTMSTCVHHEFE